ncbi:N-acyl amino acid synthase FeeM domain-containing protein [Roseiconus lacunae]|uniref:N-acyl amino acid synthase FeeM catalytic core domain-containing protein n=1 Tax=Roseiconus lacunae TaxID=2605694 RepID=A0ABT7PPB2_9BACT|nr:hypothetical protein [Roseiconus lacunae]MDM4018345.1 hypothetical protein [Roseiconus lacunae]
MRQQKTRRPEPTKRNEHGTKAAKSLTGRAVIGINEPILRLAQTRTDYEGAFSLLQRRYEESGLAGVSNASMRVMPYHLSDRSQVIVATSLRRVVGTLTLVRGAERSEFPISKTHPEVFESLQGQIDQVAEVCSLAIDTLPSASTGEMFGQLTRIMMFHARRSGIEDLVAVVNPRHVRFYERAMGFDVIGEPRPCEHVSDHLGIAIRGAVNAPSRYRKRWRKFYFEGDFSPTELAAKPMTGPDRDYFRTHLVSPPPPPARRRAG